MFDYKKFIKSRKLRVKFLRILDFVPDSLMLRLQYFIKTGRRLHLKNPQRYTEKLQWYKLYYKDPLMSQCVDKYEVRKYVEQCGLGHLLNECYGVFERAEDVKFDNLPNQFVLKDTLGGGGNDVIIVKDKSKLDILSTRKRMQEWVNYPYQGKHPGREWPYEGKKHRIIVEKFLEIPHVEDLPDYKFFCFNGKVAYVYGIIDRALGKKAQIGIFDKNFNLLPYQRKDELPLQHSLPKPFNYAQMISVAENLSRNFPQARIDLYDIGGNVVFGEITFFDGSGYMTFNPDEFDFTLGNQFVLPKKRD